MSNYLAVATVTAALKQLLEVAASSAVDGASVTTQRPEAAPGQSTADPTINLFLYQVAPNPAWRNADLPARRAEGTVINRPLTALDLHYLLSFYGDESELEPQRLMGSAMSALTARPMLVRDDIVRLVNPASTQFVDYLQQSDLADQVESVRFVPLSLDLEEMSKLWSVFFQTPYALSTAYRGSAVLIDAEAMPEPALPVRSRAIYGRTFRQPFVDKVVAEDGDNQPITAGRVIVIRGRQLRGGVTSVAIDGHEVPAADAQDSAVTITLDSPPLPESVLRAGVHGVQVVHSTLMGDPPTPRRGVSSNVHPFVLQPTIASIELSDGVTGGSGLVSGTLTLQVAPAVGPQQRVVVLLNELIAEAPSAHSLVVPARDTETDTLTLAVNGIQPGEYLVRVQIDGAESPLTYSTDPESPGYTGPTVTAP